jgi:TonB-linked SusC/RagA family outer membrane protein
MRKILLLMLLWGLGVFYAQPVMAQEKTVTGTVTGESNSLLSGVTVTIKGTNRSTQTDANGRFNIKASRGETIQFTYVGMTRKEITVSDANVVTVQMAMLGQALEEVVISQGIRRQSRALGYSTQKVQGGDLTQTNRDNFLTSLQGRVSGVTITPTSGQPGASAQVILRGPVSFDGSNQPLMVVDGLPISNKTLNQGALIGDRPNRDNDYSNRGIDLNPEDIEDITILTGPEAAALYGTEGASGVILITTKRAKSGAAKLTYGTSLTMTERPELPEIQTVYDQGTNNILDNTVRSYWGPKYAPGAVLYNNRDKFFERAFSQKHDLSLEGGTDKLSFRFSPSISKYNGNVPNTKFDRTSLRLTSSYQPIAKVKIDATVNYINSVNNKGSKGASGYYLSILSWPSDDDITRYQNADGSRRKIGGATTETDNPFWDVNKNINQDKTNRFLGNFAVTFTPTSWFNIVARVGGDVYTTTGTRAWHPQSNQGIGTNGLIESYNDNTRIFNGSIVGNFKKQFGNFTNNLSLGANYDDSRSEIISYKGESFYVADFVGINNTDPAKMRTLQSIPYFKKYGFFGNLNVGYKNFLYASVTGRMDASSTLVPNDPYFFYPGAGLSFVFSELLKNDLPVLSFGKLKANIASTGKDPRRSYLTSNRLDPSLFNGGGFALNVTLGNPALKAEFTRTYELGAELRFLKDRIGFDFTYYNIWSKDQITAPRLSYATGGVLAYINSGEVENKGVQIQLNATPIKSKNVNWKSIVNFSQNKGKVISTPANQKSFYLSDTWLYAGVRAEFIAGASISSLSSNRYLRNNNGDVLIDRLTGLPIRDGNFYVVGDRAPDFTMGFVNTVSYKNLSLSFVMDLRKGGDIFNGNALYMSVSGLAKSTLDRETPRIVQGVFQDGRENTANPTKNTISVIPYLNQSYYSASYSEEEFIEKNVNWLRMQDISLRYSLPQKFLKSAKYFKGLEIGLSAANLFIITNYSGVDPVVSGLNASVGGFSGTGIDYGVVPTSRSYTFSLNVRF